MEKPKKDTQVSAVLYDDVYQKYKRSQGKTRWEQKFLINVAVDEFCDNFLSNWEKRMIEIVKKAEVKKWK